MLRTDFSLPLHTHRPLSQAHQLPAFLVGMSFKVALLQFTLPRSAGQDREVAKRCYLSWSGKGLVTLGADREGSLVGR